MSSAGNTLDELLSSLAVLVIALPSHILPMIVTPTTGLEHRGWLCLVQGLSSQPQLAVTVNGSILTTQVARIAVV